MATGTIILPTNAAVPDAAGPPGLRFEDGRAEWLFDPDSDEIIYWTFRLPQDFASGLVARILFKMASATSGACCWATQVFAVTPGDSEDADTPGFDGTSDVDSESVPGTAGYIDEASITMSHIDGAVAGDMVQLKLYRDGDGTGGTDDATGDAELVAVTLEYTTS